jgi:hypothetical protein
MIVKEAPNDITLMSSDGRQQTILKRDIESLRSSGESFMPVGLEKSISVQQMRDLLAYLR